MSITRATAQTYIAQAAAAQASTAALAQADLSLSAALQAIGLAHPWRYLLTQGTINTASGTQDYNAPSDFGLPYDLRQTTATARTPVWIEPREFDRRVPTLPANGPPNAYTILNATAWSAGSPTFKLRLYPIPDATLALTLTYFRAVDSAADPLDVHVSLERLTLDWAAAHFLERRRASDPRVPRLWERVERLLAQAVAYDDGRREILTANTLGLYEVGALNSTTAPTG